MEPDSIDVSSITTESIDVFVSYSRDTDSHREWVGHLADRLDAEPDLHVVLDDYDLYGGKDLAHFMERCRSSHRVVFVVTSGYVSRANQRRGGVGYEADIAVAEILANQLTDKFIPVLRQGSELPTFIGAKAYIDFREGENYEQSLDALLKAIRRQTRRPRPAKLARISQPEASEQVMSDGTSTTDDSISRHDNLDIGLIAPDTTVGGNDGASSAMRNDASIIVEIRVASDRYPVEASSPRSSSDNSDASVIGFRSSTLGATINKNLGLRRNRRLAAGISFVVFLSVNLFVWDYNRVKVKYFANVSSRWGAPQGVGPLDEATRHRREIHYRFDIQRNKVRRILRMNSSNELRDDTEDFEGFAAMQVISYGEDGRIQQIDLRDHNSKLAMRKTFSQQRRTDEGVIQYVDFHAEHRDEPLALDSGTGGLGGGERSDSASDITAYEILYDSDGRVARVSYLNASRHNTPNGEGLFGQHQTYKDASLFPSGIESLGLEGTPTPGRGGTLRVALSRNTLGDLIEARYFGIDGLAILGGPGCHREPVLRDVNGNVIEFSCFGVDNEPMAFSHGFHKSTQNFDARGNLIEWAHFGIDGRPTLDSEGVHKCERRFDARGNVIEWAYFGVDGRPTWHNDGFHKGVEVVDRRGNAVQQSYFGTDRRPTVNDDKFHRYVQRIDDRGNVTEWSYFGVDGRPTVNKDGVHTVRSRYDTRDELARQAYFGIDGLPTANRYGVHRSTLAFDSRGNVIEEAYFGIDGKQTLNRDGFHRLTQSFDVGGNLIEFAYFGIDGKAVLVDGFHSVTLTFNEKRTQTTRALFGIDGAPTTGKGGFYKETTSYDARGNVVEEAYFGIDSRPVLQRDGYHKLTRVYDDLGNGIERAVFDVDGKPTDDKNGIHRVKSRFDTRGNVIEDAYFSISGMATAGRDGIHRRIWFYDSRGDVAEFASFGLNNMPTFAVSSVEFAMKALAGMEVRFVQRFSAKGLVRPRVESGVLIFGSSSEMRWSYQSPEPKLFVFDGLNWCFYVERDNQIMNGQITKSGRAAIPLIFLADAAWTNANYRISVEKRGVVETTLLRAVNTEVSLSEIKFDRDAREGLMQRVEYLDREGNRTILELSGHRKVPTPANLFQFTAPEGVQVVTSFGGEH
jgi:outer membrane lipoprotein-sorting protein